MVEVLHHRRSLRSLFGASVLDTLVHHPHTHHHLALPSVLYPPAQPLGLRPLADRLGPYHYVLHHHMLRPRRLYLLVRPFASDTYAPSLAPHALGQSLGPQAHMIYPLGLLLLTSPFGPSLAPSPVVVRALVPDYFHLWVLKYSLEYHPSERRLLDSSSLVLQVSFDRHIFLCT